MKVSVITVVRNNVDYIEDCIRSVLEQTYDNIEYIIIDGESSDGTLDIIDRYKSGIREVISEKDKGHIYAWNKGLKQATGDIVGFLHSDDIYADNKVISDFVEAFKLDGVDGVDCVYGDLVYVQRKNTNKVVRYWRSGEGNRAKIASGWMPPHPTLFIKKEIYERYGYYNIDFRISADYEIMLRFLYMHRIYMHYMHRLCVKMRTGGISNRSIFTLMQKSYEDYRACKIYGLRKAAYTVMLKNFRKIPQFFNK